jgi:hypothetical protein
MIGNELECFSQSQTVSGTSSLANNFALDLVYSGGVDSVIDVFIEADAVYTVDASTGQISVSY